MRMVWIRDSVQEDENNMCLNRLSIWEEVTH